ncbi:MAG: hypothetical protein CMA68_02090 [Euryarchaeota archaeon]|nr:hypothetical protein [Euryarchaeota archaeon]
MGDGVGPLTRAFVNFSNSKPVFPISPPIDYSSEGLSEKRILSWAVTLSFLLAYYAVLVVGIIAITFVLIIIGIGEGASFSIGSILVEILIIPLILLFIYLDGSIARTRDMLRVGSPKRAAMMILGIPIIALIVDNILVFIYAVIFVLFFGEPGTNTDLGTTWDSSNIAIFLAFISICIMTPISEELFFRGYLLDSISRMHGQWPAILISALIFGLVHLDPFTIGLATIGGVIYGWIRIRTGSLLPGIAAHAMWNTMALVVTYL